MHTTNKIISKLLSASLIMIMLILSNIATAQNLSSEKGTTSLGIGLGLPYGGIIGGKLSHNVQDNFSIFGGLGYNFIGVGFNAGLTYTVPTEKLTELYFTGMYGYNAVINIEGMPQYQKTYYGPSLGSGLKFNSRRKKGSYWDLGIMIPIRGSNYKNDIEDIENNPMITIETKPWPVQFYFGYNFTIGSKN
ncbi:hypothetical protein ACFOUP_05115 [Belliella kenyensis]|uniref:Outer membrane protein beta-barrel domain-containing protein n=1 Tax=Belliella kenyensis TaxID=1472724 RepID=A0ABV8EIB4_9BACT|nr:hypothetical protein [Belliella kenyensis]MCH7402674.1 hypothetical protein [Belliella kenyensis]MDN3603778.1 hypothetical protein [Belliella kenyensis]